MSEHRLPTPPPQGPGAALPPSPQDFSAEADALFPGSPAELTDDTPTIISRNPPRSPSEEALLSGLLHGRRLAHFELIEAIGVGGMAAVLRARDTQLDRQVALKILPPEMAADPENVRRFNQEARAAARLDHETIARVFYYGEDQNLHFIAFEFVEGENLRNTLERRGPLPVKEALHYLLQIATGLAHAAERSVVHRDIKPSNIIISPNGRAKLVDMGLARSLGPHRNQDLTHSGVTLGTFDYISPEQALEPRDADVRSDIYSLGCTFYQVLTGQSPVPEGTAARKLHHHQHVLPIDPRQLNPDVPDDVAAILARMMAKDPAQRYQQPQQLVQHLIQVTRSLGGTGDVPEGVLFMEAPLPAPPRARPLLVGGVSALIILVLVYLAGRSPWMPSPPAPSRPRPSTGKEIVTPASESPQKAGSPVSNNSVEPSPPVENASPPVLPVAKEVSSAGELAEFLRMLPSGRDVTVTVAGDIHLSGEEQAGEPGAGLVLRGHKVILKGKETNGHRPTLWAQYKGQASNWTGLVVDATEAVELQGLRVVADINENAPKMAGVLLRGARTYEVHDCEFVQGNWLPSSGLSSVSVTTSGALMPPQVSFQQCAFFGAPRLDRSTLGGTNLVQLFDAAQGGQDAVAIRGAAVVQVKNCAFGPHRSLFRFETADKRSTLEFRHCTALAADEWAAVHLDERAGCHVEAYSCFFGRVGPPPQRGMLGERKLASLIRQVDPLEGKADYKGQQNCLQNLDAIRVSAKDDGTTPWPDALRVQPEPKGTEDRVLPSEALPWKEKEPLTLLEQGLEAAVLLAAFHLDATAPELRCGPKHEQMVGVQATPWGSLYGSLPTLNTSRSTTQVRKDKVVDPTKETGGGIYRTLSAAVEDAQAGDVIVIRHNGRLMVSSTQLIKSGLTLTIKADAGYRPVLILDESVRDRDASLFRVHDGQLVLEGLEFQVRPHPDGFDSQSAATLLGDGTIQFKNCTVTLESSQRTPLAVVTLADLKEAMPPVGGHDATGPRLVFDTCLVRGNGDLVWGRSSRPFGLEVRDSLAALTGSLLNIENTREDAALALPGQRVAVSLNRLTTFLGGHLVRLRSSDLRGLVPVTVDRATACLFVAAEGKALVRLEGLRTTDDRVKDKLLWKGEQNHYSSNFMNMVDQLAHDSEMPLEVMSQSKWKALIEGDSKFVPVKFVGPLWPAVTAATMTRDSFRVESGPQNAGANLDQLPSPPDESGERKEPR